MNNITAFQSDINNPIKIGYYWQGEFQPTTLNGGVDSGRSQILSSDTASPCKVTTKFAHGLSSGKVCIDGHTPNVIVNGNHTIVVAADPFSFTITGVTGQIAGGASGVVESVIDASSYASFTVTAKPNTVDGSLTHPVITLAWIDQTIFDFTLTITAAESALISWQQEPIVVTVAWIDGSGHNDSIDIQIPLVKV